MLWGTIPFDTLAYTKRLKEAGLTERQAEAMAALINDQLATRHDFKELELRLVLHCKHIHHTSLYVP